MTTRLLAVPVMLLSLAGPSLCLPTFASAQVLGPDEDVNWFDDAEPDGLLDADDDAFDVGLEHEDALGLGDEAGLSAEEVTDFGVPDDYAADLDDDGYGLDDNDLGGRGFVFDPNYLASHDYGIDAYGAFHNDFAWETGDAGFDSWYGDSDLGWE